MVLEHDDGSILSGLSTSNLQKEERL